MRPCLAAAASLALLSASGCVTTNVMMPQGSMTFTTAPAGARVFVNGVEVCTTPCNWNEGDGLSHRFHLQIRKEGFKEADFYLDKELHYFSNTFSVAAYRMPRQVFLTLEPLPGGPPPLPEGQPPLPKAPSL